MIKRLVLKEKKVAKCDICKAVKQITLTFLVSAGTSEELMLGTLEACHTCGQEMSNELGLGLVPEEFEVGVIR